MTKTIESKIHAEARRILDVAIKADDWDETPMLFILMDDDQLGVLPIFGHHPAEFAEALAASNPREVLKLDPARKVVGVALQNEGYGFNKYDAEKQAWLDAGRRIGDHPDGLETKVSTSYDGVSTSMSIFYRGSDKPDVLSEKGLLTGRVPDSLVALFEALNR